MKNNRNSFKSFLYGLSITLSSLNSSFIQTSEQKDQPKFYPIDHMVEHGCKNLQPKLKAIIEQGRCTDLHDGDLLYSKKMDGVFVYVAARLAEDASPIMHLILGAKKVQGVGPKQAVMMATTCWNAGPDKQKYLPLMQKTKEELERRGYGEITNVCARCETVPLFNQAFNGRPDRESQEFFWQKMRELFNSDYGSVVHCWKQKSECTQHQQ